MRANAPLTTSDSIASIGICHGAQPTTCRAGRIPLRIKLRTAPNSLAAVLSACCRFIVGVLVTAALAAPQDGANARAARVAP